MAEREGFEPPIALRLCLISSQVHSTGLCHLSAYSVFSFCPSFLSLFSLRRSRNSRRSRLRAAQVKSTGKGRKVATLTPRSKRSFRLRQRALDESGHAVMKLLEALVANVNHVAGFVPVKFNVPGQRLRNGQVLLFILRGEERRGQVVVSAVDHDAQARIGFEGFGQIDRHVEIDGIAAM